MNYTFKKRKNEKLYRRRGRRSERGLRAVWIIPRPYCREKILICPLGVQPCFVERHFRFSLLLMDPEYFGVSRRKKKCYYRLWVWVSTGPSMNTINQLAIPFSLFYARQLYRILRSVIWGAGEGTSSRNFNRGARISFCHFVVAATWNIVSPPCVILSLSSN